MSTRLGCIVGILVSIVSVANAGEVRGIVTDSDGYALRDAEVRLLSGVARIAEYRTTNLRDGSFRIAEVRPGVYAIRVWVRGFREEVRSPLLVTGDSVTETGSIHLQFGGCEVPETICDDFGLSPSSPEPPPLRRGRVVLGRNCGVNLDEGLDNAICAEDRRVDLWFRAESDSRLELQPGQAAALAQFTNYRCKSAHFEKDSWLMNGRGPGTELCVQTSEGHHAFVYVEEEVSNRSSSVKLYYVTYK